MTDDINDDELERHLARALRDAFPESTDTPSLLPAVRKRARRRRQRLQGGGALGAAAAVAAAVVVPTTLIGGGSTRPSPSNAAASPARAHPSPAMPSSSSTTAPSALPPIWAAECLAADPIPAPQFVGLTLTSARSLATKEDIQLVVRGQGGQCDKIVATVAYANGVDVVLDARGKVVAAQHEPHRPAPESTTPRPTPSGAARPPSGTHASPQGHDSSPDTTSPLSMGKCLVPGSPAAPQFVGLTLTAARRLATKEGIQLVILGQGGHCAKDPAVAYPNGVNVQLDARDHIAAAQHR